MPAHAAKARRLATMQVGENVVFFVFMSSTLVNSFQIAWKYLIKYILLDGGKKFIYAISSLKIALISILVHTLIFILVP